MGSQEFSKELNIPVFSLKAESIGIIGKDVGTMSLTIRVLVGFNTLGDDCCACGGNQPGFVV